MLELVQTDYCVCSLVLEPVQIDYCVCSLVLEPVQIDYCVCSLVLEPEIVVLLCRLCPQADTGAKAHKLCDNFDHQNFFCQLLYRQPICSSV